MRYNKGHPLLDLHMQQGGAGAHLAEDAAAKELAGHVGDSAIGARLHLGLDGQIARQPKVRHLGREAVRLLL